MRDAQDVGFRRHLENVFARSSALIPAPIDGVIDDGTPVGKTFAVISCNLTLLKLGYEKYVVSPLEGPAKIEIDPASLSRGEVIWEHTVLAIMDYHRYRIISPKQLRRHKVIRVKHRQALLPHIRVEELLDKARLHASRNRGAFPEFDMFVRLGPCNKLRI